MPQRMDVVIYCQEQPADEEGAPEVPPAITTMKAWFVENSDWPVEEASLPESGAKAWFDGPLFAGGLVHCNAGDLADAFPTWDWEWPEEAVLIINHEVGYTEIVRGDGARMYTEMGGTGSSYTPAGPEPEVDEAELRVAALRHSAGVCVHCGQPPRPSAVEKPASVGG